MINCITLTTTKDTTADTTNNTFAIIISSEKMALLQESFTQSRRLLTTEWMLIDEYITAAFIDM